MDIHEQAFIKAREMLSSKKTLTYYNPKNQTQLKVDASRIGLGFVLKQFSNGMWNTVQAGSRFLSEAETRYAMIELELLAIVWAAQKNKNVDRRTIKEKLHHLYRSYAISPNFE